MNDEADNWAKWDADHLTYYAGRLVKAYHEMGRLPYPCAAKMREVHEKLGEVIADEVNRAQRATAELRIEVWRTQSSNNRAVKL